MLIVLEGCDGSGKTTLANLIAPLIGAEIIHCTAETPNTYEWFIEILDKSKEVNIIADRFCYGQFVYQDPCDRSLNEVALRSLESMLKAANTKVVYVDADSRIIKHRLNKRGELTEIPVEEIQRRYRQVFTESTMDVYVIKTDEPSMCISEFAQRGGLNHG